MHGAPVVPERDLPCPAIDGSIRRRFLSLDLPCKKKETRSLDHGSSAEAIFKYTYLTPTVGCSAEGRGGETDQKGILQLASSVAARRDGEAAANNSLSTSSKRQVLVPLHVRLSVRRGMDSGVC